MSVAIVTGSSGLIGSEAVRFLTQQGLDVVGIDNDMRGYFFGAGGSVAWNTERLRKECPRFTSHALDIRDQPGIDKLFAHYGPAIQLVIHAAAQPSHDWAAREPLTDFSINATGTMILLEAVRRWCPQAVFIFMSTNKVYGDAPNSLPLVEQATRWDVRSDHAYAAHGIDEAMSIDQCKHSLFGCSKAAADLLVQEYGRYFGMKTGLFRGGCLTGPAHSGVELHGFLAYLVHCAVQRKPYTIYGYKGKQVRDNIHSVDLVNALWAFAQNPRPGAVYNMGGSRHSHCSVLEAMSMIERLTGEPVQYTLSDQARSGDHIWWVSDVRRFQADYPSWTYRYNMESIVKEIVDAMRDRQPAR